MNLSSKDKRKLVLSRIAILNKLIGLYGRKCWYCGTPFQTFDEVELDHIVPRSRGGKNTFANYAIACLFCNGAKGAFPLDEFLKWLRKAKKPLIHLHEQAKEDEQHWRDWGTDIKKGLRKAGTGKGPRTTDRRIAVNVRVVQDGSCRLTPPHGGSADTSPLVEDDQ